jgi:hypothetical protein
MDDGIIGEHQNQDGTLKPPEIREVTDIPLEGLGNQASMPIRRMTLDEADEFRAERCFKYHAPKPDQIPRYTLIRDYGKQFAKLLIEKCPAGKERSQALGNIQQTVMWANAAIAIGECGE